MKINVQVSKLIDIMDLVTRFVSKNATLPILQNVYIKASIDGILFRATDMEKYIEIEMPGEVKLEWAITVNAKTFSDIIKTVEDNEIELSVDQKSYVITMKSAKDTFDINGIPASEYVALPDMPRDNLIWLDTQLFSKGIDKVEFSVTEKSFSPVMTWMYVRSKVVNDVKQLIFVGTDSFRLSEYKTIPSKLENDISLIIPKLTVIDVKKINDYAISKECDEVKIYYSQNLIAFEYPNVNGMKIISTSLLIQWNFPEYDNEGIMPKTFNTKIMLDKSLCEKAIRKIWILTRDINNFIQVTTNKDSVIISSGKTDKWAGTTSLPAIIEWQEVSFGVNWRYISDLIKILEWDELIFNIVDGQKPMILEDKNDANYKYVVRPLMN